MKYQNVFRIKKTKKKLKKCLKSPEILLVRIKILGSRNLIGVLFKFYFATLQLKFWKVHSQIIKLSV